MDQDTKSLTSTEKIPDTDDEPKIPEADVHRELSGICDKVKGSNVFCYFDDKNFPEAEFNLDEVEHTFIPYDGDVITVFVSVEPPIKVLSIQPEEELKKHTGKITHMTKSFAIVDDEIIYFIPNNTEKFEFKKNDEVECVVIEGDYKCGKSKYRWRCERMHKVKQECDDATQWLNEHVLDTIEEEANLDSDNENEIGEPKMEFEALKGREPNQEWYDMPLSLYETLSSGNHNRITKKLKEFVPAELNYKTYKKRFHAHVHLEEFEMQLSFEKYKSREIWIEPENRRFSIMCSKITELRPPIAVGDRIEVRKHSNPSYYYRGSVERVLPDRFILKFRSDFVNDFLMGEPFEAQFFHNRVVFVRKHAAIEYAKQKFSESFLFPKKITTAKELQLNAEIVDGKLHLNGKQTVWYKDLNEEQKEAVAVALRGECRPLPLIIFGPAGTGKTSTLIEIVLQIYANKPNSKILIATQSNHAANVVATRLVEANLDIGSNMLRLVSNAVLDRKTLPQGLHKFSASVMHSNIDNLDHEDDVNYDDMPKDVRRNCRLDYLKKFQIIIGTCVGLGILFNSEFSDKYFSHVFIDEAAQCSECEAMIPITSINPDGGQIILAGDLYQLPPISLSNHAKHYDLVKSMLERYYEMYRTMNTTDAGEVDSRLMVKLRRNYRSIPSILDYYNKQFYGSTLIPIVCGSTSVEAMKLKELGRFLPHCSDSNGNEPFGITFINVEGRNERLENKKSWENKEEAALIKAFVAKLLQFKVDQSDIGVITAYHAQVLALKKVLKGMKKVRVGTVEEFQGEEKMIIIFSAVKTSGMEKALQFIFCKKRLNTAVSRARMLVAVFGKASLLSTDPNWHDLIQYCMQNNAYIEGKDIVQIL